MQYSLNKIKNNGITEDLTYILLQDTKTRSHNRNQKAIRLKFILSHHPLAGKMLVELLDIGLEPEQARKSLSVKVKRRPIV